MQVHLIFDFVTENTFLIVFFSLTDISATTDKNVIVNILSRDKRLRVVILSFKQCLVLTQWPVLVLYVNQVNQEGHQYYQDQQHPDLVQCSEEENGGGVHGSAFGLQRTEKDMSVVII